MGATGMQLARFGVFIRGRRSSAGLVLLALALTVGTPLQARAQTARPDVLTCVESLTELILFSTFSPNTTVNYTVASAPTGIVDFARTVTGPFSDPLVIPVTHDASGNGRVNFVMRGIAAGTTTLDASSAETGQTNTLTVAVDRVTSVEALHNDQPLEANPAVGGGVRIFPDLETPAGSSADARRITLRATTELGMQDLVVFFGGFDMDDPSPGDRTPADEGPGDNNATDAFLSSFSDTVDPETGIAEITVTLTRQPGDNFRFFAGCSLGYLQGVTARGIELFDREGDRLPTPGAETSDMVTIWRRLHLEVDTMEAVDGNQILGNVVNIRHRRTGGVVTQSIVSLGNTRTSDDPPEGPVAINMRRDTARDEFVNGALDVTGFGQFDVAANARDRVTVFGEVPISAQGASLVLVDDDDIPGGGAGDEGAAVPAPDTSLLESVLAQGYVLPVFDLTTGAAPFVLNLPADDRNTPQEDFTDVYRFDNLADHQNQNYWIAYLLGGYQFVTGLDDDPESEEARLGQTDREGKGSVVFAESIRDLASAEAKCQPAGVVAHEIVHLFVGLGHAQSGLMQDGCAGGTDLAAESLIAMRQKLFP